MSQMEDQVGRMDAESRAAARVLVGLMAAGLASAWGEEAAHPSSVAGVVSLRDATADGRTEPPAARGGAALPADARALCRDASSEGIAAEPPFAEPPSWPRVHAMAVRNSVEGLTWAGVEALGLAGELPEGLAGRWRDESLMTMWRRLQFDAERERVLAALKAAGFAVLPLKGAAMAHLYPDPSMRSMADNDILYGRVEPLPADSSAVEGSASAASGLQGSAGTVSGPQGSASTAPGLQASAETASSAMHGLQAPAADEPVSGEPPRPQPAVIAAPVSGGAPQGWRLAGSSTPAGREAALREGTRAAVEVMKGLGYEAAHTGTGAHDSFEMRPIFNFELHRALFSPGSDPVAGFLAYYENPWLRAVQSADDPLQFSYSHEDAYVFCCAHAYKHFDGGGCGPRALADEAVLLREHGAALNWDYVETQLAELGILEFESSLRRAALAFFPGAARAAAPAPTIGDAAGSATGKAAAGAASAEAVAAVAAVAPVVPSAPQPAPAPVVPPAPQPAAPAPTAADWELALFMCGCGVYGNTSTRVKQQLEREREAGAGELGARMRYVWSRLWLSPEQLANAHPFIAAHPWLRPLSLPLRIGKALTVGFSHAHAELRALRK